MAGYGGGTLFLPFPKDSAASARCQHPIGRFSYSALTAEYVSLRIMTEKRETILSVHGNADGYWYIGAGRSIAEGPYRNPHQLLSVASVLLAAEPHWRIDVFDVAGNKIISYSSEDLDASDLDPLRGKRQWSALAHAVPHGSVPH
jgi:hypothetical protein